MPPENEGESLLDAINAAIPSDDTPAEEVAEEEVVEGEETPEGEETEETPEGEEAAEGEEEADGEEDPEAAAAAAAAKKPADLINDPLPRGTLQATSERFKHVVNTLKTETARADKAEAERDEVISEITGAGMGGQEYAMMLEYARGVNSGSYDGMKKSYDILMHELKNLATALGEPLPGTNPVDAYADLVKEVNDKAITPQRAMEIALQRNRTAAQTKLGQQRQSTQQSTQQSQQAQAAGRTALTALGKELAAKDGPAEYRRKAGLVVGMLKDTMGDIPPAKWVRAFKAAYDQVPAAPKVAKPGLPKNQPLRGNKAPAGAGANTKAPKNLREAIDGAFQ